MKMQKVLFMVVAMLFHALQVNAQQDIIGKWKTIDDQTGEAKAVVEFYEKGGKVFGRIVNIIKEEDRNGRCELCSSSDPRKDQLVQGMTIIRNLVPKGKEWVDGDILDPENGKVYSCKIWIEGGDLMVRGYVGFSLMGRTQVWKKAGT